MKFCELLEKRKSIRTYTNAPIEKEKLDKIIEAAFSAPSAGNLQAYKILIVKNEKIKKALYYACLEQNSILSAQIILVFCTDKEQSAKKYGTRGENLYCLQDATIAAAYAQLEITNLGLGSVWIGAFEDKKVAEILKIESGKIPIAIIPIGYPVENEKARERIRKAKNEMVKEF